MNSLDRFKVAQEEIYPRALEEIKNGMKCLIGCGLYFHK